MARIKELLQVSEKGIVHLNTTIQKCLWINEMESFEVGTNRVDIRVLLSGVFKIVLSLYSLQICSRCMFL